MVGHTLFCKDIEVHVLELGKFTLTAQQVQTPLERWCYFLKHGEELDEEGCSRAGCAAVMGCKVRSVRGLHVGPWATALPAQVGQTNGKPLRMVSKARGAYPGCYLTSVWTNQDSTP